MGRMVTVEEWAEIHGKTPATVRRKIHTNAWPNAKQAKLLCEIRRLMPPVVYTTAEDGTVICMVPCTHHTHIATNVTADEMNDLWRAAPSRRSEILQRERRAFT